MTAARILLAACAAALALAAVARADIREAATIDGPSADILELGGVAMAEDGTGGLVYRKRVDGVAHVFVSQFTGGAWQPPQRVDAGQRFDSSFPAIGAADDGQLVAVWVQEFGVGTDRLYSAALGRGASRFQAPTLIDAGVGEATGTFPSVSLNRGGAGYVAYTVVTSADSNASLPAGYATVERRMARFNGQYWSGMGVSFARNSAVPVRRPTAQNAPRVVADTAGNGIVAWQEPDDDFVDRVWARRIFGGTLGITQQVSPSTWGDKPLRGAADAFDLATAGFGEGALTFRQQPSQNSALPRAVDMVSLIPETFATASNKFIAPRILDGEGDAPGAATVDVTGDGVFLSAFARSGRSYVVRGDEQTLAAPAQVGGTGVSGDPVSELGSSGAAASAFPVTAGRSAGLEVHELRADGVPIQRTISTARGGLVTGLRSAGSGFGDALLAWVQGSGANTQIGASSVDAPPDVFQVQTPIDWVRSRRIPLTWDDAPHAIGDVTYTVTVDDVVAAEGLTGTGYTLGPDDTDEGSQTVLVIATDSGGQETTSDPAELRVDRRPPRVAIRSLGRRRVSISVKDGESGLNVASTALRIGNGRLLTAQRAWRLRLTRKGRFRTVVVARDNAGNRGRVSRMVRVR